MSQEDDMLISEVAQELKVSHVTVWRHIRSKKLPARRVGPIYLVKRHDFEAFKALDRPIGRPRTRPAVQ
jgi:excisionase family DNA binding protein